ncbi:filamentous hemagglutinin N-terminal domain-containing protein [Cyanobacteria bacterium FACHB-472]|nr:filamentous hemagglutinin N-terminal domain-containing protein [Cyanobacteria bacterium FACHB-472]
MKLALKSAGLLLAPLAFLQGIDTKQALSTPITPAKDGTGTVATPQGNTIEITGGRLSGDGRNLFHSFEEFGVSTNQTANFISNPQINNILSRIVDGKPSTIAGLIKVTGGTSNLYLMNPSGIVFGANARLDVAGDFNATTANSIGFGSHLFNASGDNNYAVLSGKPSSFNFTTPQPGAIINSGNLAVNHGKNLVLIGGTVASTGTLSAPGGNITVAAVPGQNMVRISESGQILSVELPASKVPNSTLDTKAEASSLPQLLTGGDISHAKGLSTNSTGEVILTGSGIKVEPGDVAVRQLNSRNATLSADRNLTLVNSNLRTSRDMNLLAKDTVVARDSVAKPFVAKAGGNLNIQGNKSVDILALNHPETTPFKSDRNLTIASDGNISGDAHYSAGGDFSIRNLSGGVGKFVSIYDPVITSDGDVTLGDYTGASLKIVARGKINITGNVLINAIDPALDANTRVFILQAGVPGTTDNVPFTGTPAEYFDDTGSYATFSKSPATTPATITVAGTIDSENSQPLRVNVSATGDISTQTIRSYGADININSSNGSINTSDPVNQVYNLDSRNGSSNAGKVTLTAPNGNITSGDIYSSGSDYGTGTAGSGGDITLKAGGNIVTETLNSSSICEGCTSSGNAGAIALQGKDIETKLIDARSIGSGKGGNVDITAAGYVRVTNASTALNSTNFSIATSGSGGGGAVTIKHQGGVATPPTPFVVGDSTTNGTAKSITTGTSTISPPESIPGVYTSGNININSSLPVTPPSPTPTPVTPPSPTPTPVTPPSPNPTPVIMPSPNPNPVTPPSPTPTPVTPPSPNPSPVIMPSPNPRDNFQLDKGIDKDLQGKTRSQVPIVRPNEEKPLLCAADSLAQEERLVLQKLPRCQNRPEFLPKPAKLNNQKQLTP